MRILTTMFWPLFDSGTQHHLNMTIYQQCGYYWHRQGWYQFISLSINWLTIPFKVVLSSFITILNLCLQYNDIKQFAAIFSRESDSRIANVRLSVSPSVRPSQKPLSLSKSSLSAIMLTFSQIPISHHANHISAIWPAFATSKPFWLVFYSMTRKPLCAK